MLLETLNELLVYPSVDGKIDRNELPVCYFCMKKRRKADMRFLSTLKKRFSVQEIEVERRNREQYGAIFL